MAARIIGRFECAICSRGVFETNELVMRLLYGPKENRRRICWECYKRLDKWGCPDTWMQLVKPPSWTNIVRRPS